VLAVVVVVVDLYSASRSASNALIVPLRQRRRAIEALEARASPLPPDSVATLVNSLQNRVKSITTCA